jgi:hypothetical protein
MLAFLNSDSSLLTKAFLCSYDVSGSQIVVPRPTTSSSGNLLEMQTWTKFQTYQKRNSGIGPRIFCFTKPAIDSVAESSLRIAYSITRKFQALKIHEANGNLDMAINSHL